MTNMPSGSDLGSTGRTSGGTAQQVKDTVRDTTNNITNVAKEQARSAYDKKKNLLFGEVDSLGFEGLAERTTEGQPANTLSQCQG